MTIPAVIRVAENAATQMLVGGVPLLVRHIKTLYKLGVRDFYLYGAATLPPVLHQTPLPPDAHVHAVPPAAAPLPVALPACVPTPDDVLLVCEECVVDPRLYAELLTRTAPHWVAAPQPLADALPAAARVSSKALDLWASAGLDAWLAASPRLRPETLDDYLPSHRGPVPFYVCTVTTPAAAMAATQAVIRAAQKHALDLPALLLNPWWENRLVTWLCPTRMTPNQVSLVTGLLGFAIAWLFWHGWLCLGITLTYAVSVLDGVDGKLARTRLQTSRLGELEHILDFFVEHAWYLSLTAFFATSTHDPSWWWIGAGLMLSDLLDNLVYGAGQVLFHKQLDELSPWDRRFRLIAGRRNIYTWMMFVGFWAGWPTAIFTATCVWALTTVAIHAGRLAYHWYRRLALA